VHSRWHILIAPGVAFIAADGVLNIEMSATVFMEILQHLELINSSAKIEVLITEEKKIFDKLNLCFE
jgi:hypothetical protein